MRDWSLKKVTFILLIVLFFSANEVHAETIYASEDSYVENTMNTTNFGNAAQLQLRDNSVATVFALMKFNVPYYTYNGEAYLWIYVESGSSTLKLYRTSYDWSENTITWSANRPSVEPHNDNALESVTITSSELPRWYRFNISSSISTPGTYSFSLKSVYGGLATISSRESANKPYISLTPVSKISDLVWNSKTNDDTPTFLVNSGESIQFSINVPDAIKYNWEINKNDQSNNAPTFTFTVPSCDHSRPYSCIWEIHSIANNSNGNETHREWVISSLSASEAPDFIEYFVDRDNRYRNGYVKDPWGRDLSQWSQANSGQTKNYIDKGYLTNGGSYDFLILPRFNITYGTFKWKVKNPMGAVTTMSRFKVVGTPTHHRYNASGPVTSPWWNLEWYSYDQHDYFAINSGAITWWTAYSRIQPLGGYIPISRRGVQQAPDGRDWTETDWVNLTVIHTRDHWWGLWIDDQFEPQTLANYDAFNNATSMYLFSYLGLMMDNIEAYNDRYIYPDGGIHYGWYAPWWIHRWPNVGVYDPANATGIVVDGHGVTLKKIADAINNPSIFTYNDATRTAVTTANISLKAGAELVIDNEKLLFDTSGRTLEFNLKNGATLRMEGSTIGTVGSNPFIWNIASSAAQTIWDEEGNRFSDATTNSPKNNPVSDFKGRFIAERSTIDNSANLFLDGAIDVILNNTFITNIHSSDHGDYTIRGFGYDYIDAKKYQAVGKKALWIAPRNDFANFVFNNVTITSAEPDAQIKIVGGEWIQNTTNIFNSDLRGVTVSTKKAMKYEYFIMYHNKTENSSVSLVNSMFSNLRADTNHSKIMVKYYLDVLAKDANGNSVSGLNITVRNENNNAYPPENIYEMRDYVNDCATIGQGGADPFEPGNPQHDDCLTGGVYEKWFNGYSNAITSTLSNGHTPLPSDKNRTVVLTDFVVMNETGVQMQTEFTYTISAFDPANIWTGVSQTVYPNGTVQQQQPIAQVTGVNPDASWYRPNPNMPTNTITIQINHTRTTISAAPSVNPVNMTVNYWNASAVIVANFTADTTDGNGVVFTANLKPYTNYLIKKDGANYTIIQSDSIGKITFSNSAW